MSVAQNIRPHPMPRPVPTPADSAPIRLELSVRHHQMEAYNPDALTLAAEVLAAMRALGYGHAAELAATHSDRYRRAQFAGLHDLTVLDLCALGLESALGRAVVLGGVRKLLAALGCRVEPALSKGLGVHETMAQVHRSVGEVAQAYARAMADGSIDDHEREQLFDETTEAQELLHALALELRS